MSLHSEKDEIKGVVNRLIDSLSSTITWEVGRVGIVFRVSLGDLQANYYAYLNEGTFSQKLLDCFTNARNANVSFASFSKVHNQLFLENPVGEISQTIVMIAIVYCLAAEARVLTGATFVSQDDVRLTIQRAVSVFETAKVKAADAPDSSVYRSLITLGGSLVNHLTTTSYPLPRLIMFDLAVSMPALSLSQLIYHTADRSDEILNENKIIHPAFCPRSIRGLSS